MAAPAPVYRGQGNAAFRSEARTRTLKRGQTVPYDVNGSPSGVGITTNPLTIAASGGAAPGSTFNGAAARTIDYSTVGAAPLSHTHGFADVTGIPTSSLIYRKSAGTGPAKTNTLATLKTDLGLTGTNSGDQFTNMTATRLLGRYSAGFGAAQEIILGTNLSFDTGTGTLNAAGGTANAVDAQVDFGAGGLTDYAEVTVAAAWVAAGTNIVVSPLVPTTADHDPEDALIEGLSAAIQSIIPGVSFVLGVHAPCGTWGRYDFACIGV